MIAKLLKTSVSHMTHRMTCTGCMDCLFVHSLYNERRDGFRSRHQEVQHKDMDPSEEPRPSAKGHLGGPGPTTAGRA